MIPGYNHNVKYKEQVYHIQTEDSGLDNPHIITHLFMGGNIIESRKISYADRLQNDNLAKQIVDLMQGQHKSMLKALIKGALDDKLAARSVNAATLNGPAPLNVDAGAQDRVSFGMPNIDKKAEPKAPAPPPVAAPPPPATTPPQQSPSPASTFFGDAPPAPTERVIEAATLEKAFESRDESAVDSIFGEDLISEKSLDEVILSYLAEDMSSD